MRSMIFFTLGLAQVAYAQSDPMAEAEAAFNEAEAYYALGDWKNALEYYKKSFLLSKNPVLLFNLGQCQRQLGQYEDAQRSYKNFLRQTNLPASDGYRIQAEKLLAEVEAKLAAGKTNPTSQPVSNNNPVSQPAVEKPDVTPATQPTEEKAPKSPMSRAVPLFGASGVALGLGALAGLSARGNASKLENLHQDANSSQGQFDDIANRAKRQAFLCDLSLLAGVGAAVGGFLVFQSARKKAETSVQLTPSGATVSVRF